MGKQTDKLKCGYLIIEALFKNEESFTKYCTKEGISKNEIDRLNDGMLQKNISSGAKIKVYKRRDFSSLQIKSYTLTDLKADLTYLAQNYKPFSYREIGKSVCRSPIYEIEIGNGPISVHLNGSFHANEWITSLFLIHFTEYILSNEALNSTKSYLSYKDLFSWFTFSIVPMVNPDGVSLVLEPSKLDKVTYSHVLKINKMNENFLSWKSNIRGVDLNKQFPANWEKEKMRKNLQSFSSRDFTGFEPLSEPESRVMAKLAYKKNFDYLFCFHTQGKEIYWGYEGLEPIESEKIASVMEEYSSYKCIRNVDSHAGFRDWCIKEFRRAGFTVELGKGINPLPIKQFEQIFHETTYMMERVFSYIITKAKYRM